MTMQYLYPIFAYLLGSVPFGLILSNLFGNGKLRNSGSQNIGTTNVMRTQGKTLGILTFLLDFGKGAAAVYLLHADKMWLNIAIAAAPVIGHIFPVWLKFKGGKGIATYFGILLPLSQATLIATLIAWILGFVVSKISAVGGMISVMASLLVFYLTEAQKGAFSINMLYVLTILVVVIIFRHKENIQKLLKYSKIAKTDER